MELIAIGAVVAVLWWWFRRRKGVPERKAAALRKRMGYAESPREDAPARTHAGSLVLITLNLEQIRRAKEANGSRKRITHALVCGQHGQMFGTENQCLKYFEAWNPNRGIEIAPGEFEPMFPGLFEAEVRTDRYEITEYEPTWDLVGKLIETSESGSRPAPASGTRLNIVCSVTSHKIGEASRCGPLKPLST